MTIIKAIETVVFPKSILKTSNTTKGTSQKQINFSPKLSVFHAERPSPKPLKSVRVRNTQEKMKRAELRKDGKLRTDLQQKDFQARQATGSAISKEFNLIVTPIFRRLNESIEDQRTIAAQVRVEVRQHAQDLSKIEKLFNELNSLYARARSIKARSTQVCTRQLLAEHKQVKEEIKRKQDIITITKQPLQDNYYTKLADLAHNELEILGFKAELKQEFEEANQLISNLEEISQLEDEAVARKRVGQLLKNSSLFNSAMNKIVFTGQIKTSNWEEKRFKLVNEWMHSKEFDSDISLLKGNIQRWTEDVRRS